MSTLRNALLLGLTMVLAACATSGSGPRLPERIVIERGEFIPEGVAFNPLSGRLLVGSLVDGTVYTVEPNGSLEPFATDPELVSSVGIEVDAARGRLLVANADYAVIGGQGPGTAKLGIYRLATGERIAMVDLGGLAGGADDSIVFVNDVTVDDSGNVYLTDTYMNVIYRVDPDLQASVLHRFEPTTGLGLNGIVYHESGCLIVVAVGGQGLLYRIPLDDPGQAQPIGLSQPATGADGLVWSRDGRLIVVSNSSSSALAYRSDDNWKTAQLVGTAEFAGQATTGAAVGDSIYVVQPHFNDAEPPVILRTRF